MGFWSKQKELPTEPVRYYPGTVVKTEAGLWYIGEKTRMEIPNKRVRKSWSFPRIVESTEAALAKYPKMGKLGFRPGTLLFDFSSGVYYVILKDHKIVLVDDPDILVRHNMFVDEAITVSADDIALHERVEYPL